MIVRNESFYIENCLNHHKQLVDEIIVVDTGSTDNTKELCTALGAKVYDFEWCDDFSKARNESLKHATRDWILVLDADELISARGMSQILALTNQNDRKTCYLLTQRHYCNRINSETLPVMNEYPEYERGMKYFYESSIVRLFPRENDLFFSYCVHEMIETQAVNARYRIVPSDILIHHYGQISSTHKDKTKYYIELGLKKAKENPEDSKTFYELGLQFNSIGEHAKAAEYFAEAYQLNNISEIACEEGSAYLNDKKFNSAEQSYVKAIKLNRYNPFAYVGLSHVYLQTDQLEKALIAIESAISLSPKNLYNLKLYATILEKNKRALESVHIYKKLIKLDPKNTIQYRNEATQIIERYRLFYGELDYVD